MINGKDIAPTLNVVVPGPALVFASAANIKAPESSKPFSELVVLMFVITGIVRLGILTGLIGHEFKSDWVWAVGYIALGLIENAIINKKMADLGGK